MAETLFRVKCRGVIDDATRARISLEFPSGGWTGEAMQPGQPFPGLPQSFQFNVVATSADEAIDQVREIVDAAGGHVDKFEATPVPRDL